MVQGQKEKKTLIMTKNQPFTRQNQNKKRSPSTKSKPEEEKLNYDEKPDSYKPKPGEKKPEYVSKLEGEKTSNYGEKPESYKPKPEGEKKENLEYAPKPKQKEEKLYYGEKIEKLAVEGHVFCESGSKYYPIQGAITKVTCQVVGRKGVEKTLPICSVSTDAKGYFYATVSSLSLEDKSSKLKDCKAFLERSPLEFCNVATDVNKGMSGVPLSGTYRYLNEHHTKLYSVGPFFCASEAHAVPNNGY